MSPLRDGLKRAVGENQIARDVLAHRALVDVEQPRRRTLGKAQTGGYAPPLQQERHPRQAG